MKKRAHYAYFFVLPGVLLLMMFLLASAVLAMGFGFLDFNLLRPADATFCGLDNAIRLFQDKSFMKTLALLVKTNLKGIGLFRSAYFSPLVTSMSVVAILWTFIFNSNPTQGLLNAC